MSSLKSFTGVERIQCCAARQGLTLLQEQLESSNFRTRFNLELDLARNVDIEQMHLAVHRDEIA
jgi:hypothetical protein